MGRGGAWCSPRPSRFRHERALARQLGDARLRKMARRVSTDAHLMDLLTQARALLASEMGPHLSLADAANRLATSTRQLERAFAELGASTFRAELTAARVQRATLLLEDPSATIADVARSIGYNQPAHFAKAFRQDRGMAPSEWRRRVYGHGRPRSRDRFAAQIEDERRAAEDKVRRWAEDRVAAAAQNGRTAWPASIPSPAED
jgi:AraC family transcriptional regulator, regulatory protein of adaptative response / methylphosphotriester-DNA alkyltransferase methyltransferase